MIRTLRFFTMLFVGLSMGMAFCHLLQMAPRMRYDVWLWKSTKSMFELFGPSFGILVEGAAVLFSITLLFFIRHNRAAFQWTLICALSILVAHLAWWFLISPVNQETITWTQHTIPNNWFLYRAQWEYTHAVRALFEILGFSCLTISMLGADNGGTMVHERN